VRPPAATILGGVSTRLLALSSQPVDEFAAFELQVLGLGAMVLSQDAERGPGVRAREHRELADLLRRARARGVGVDLDDDRSEVDLAALDQSELDRRLAEVQQAVADLHEALEAVPADERDTDLIDDIWTTLARCNARRRGAG
jgi:hypothetical protein